MDRKSRVHLEERLVEGRWLGEELLSSAKEESLRIGESLWMTLVRLHYLSQEDIMLFFSCESGIPYVRVADYTVRPEILDILDHSFCVQHLLFPLFRVGGTLYVASTNPFDASIVDAVAHMSGMNAEFLLATAESIRTAQDSYWYLEEGMFAAEEFVAGPERRLHGVSLCRKSERLPFKVPVTLSPKGDDLGLNIAGTVEGVTRDITKDAQALGIESPVYLPPGLPIYIAFKLPERTLSCEADVVNCRVEKGRKYLAGIALTAISPGDKDEMAKLI
jgi:hypothetical protein